MAETIATPQKPSAKALLIKAFEAIEKNADVTSPGTSDDAGEVEAVIAPAIANEQTVTNVRKHLPLATSYKIKRYFGNEVNLKAINSAFRRTDSISTEKIEDTDGCDEEHDHAHFTMFSFWSTEFTTLIHASINTLRLWLTGKLKARKTLENTEEKNEATKNPHEKDIVPLWFAFSSLLIFPLLLVPFLYFGHRMMSQMADIGRGWLRGWGANNDEPRLKSWAWWLVTLGLGLPILLMPFVFTPNFLHNKPVEPHIKPEKYPFSKALSRVLVLFAALGTGFIAVTAIIASPIGASLGLWVWMFFLAGFLSEWQTLELSMYDLLHKLFKHKNVGLKHELHKKLAKKLNKEWGVPKDQWLTFDQWKTLCPKLESQAEKMLWMQRAAFGLSLVIGIGVFALAYSHTATALPILFGVSAFSTTPIGLVILLSLIATGTALAYFCLVYRGLRETIYNPYGDHLIGAWVKTLHKLYSRNSDKGQPFLGGLKTVATTIFALGMSFLVVFYLLTAGPAWCEAALGLYKSPIIALLLDIVYYPIMLVFYSNASKKTCDAVISLGINVWNGLKNITQESFDAYNKIIGDCKYFHTKVLLGLLWVFETALKTICFLVLDFGLTLGLFFLHLIGDAAIGSEEHPPQGFGANTVLILNSLSHFFADFGFILEWSKGGLDHEHHHHEVAVAPYQVNFLYGLACITLIVTLVHMALHKIVPTRIAHPMDTLMPNRKEVDADKLASQRIASKLAPAESTIDDDARSVASDEEEDHHEHPRDHWLGFVQGKNVELWSVVQANKNTHDHDIDHGITLNPLADTSMA